MSSSRQIRSALLFFIVCLSLLFVEVISQEFIRLTPKLQQATIKPNVSVKVSTSIVQTTSFWHPLRSYYPQRGVVNEPTTIRTNDRARRLTLNDSKIGNNPISRSTLSNSFPHPASSDSNRRQVYQSPSYSLHNNANSSAAALDSKLNLSGRIIDLSTIAREPAIVPFGYKQSTSTSLNFAPIDIRYSSAALANHRRQQQQQSSQLQSRQNSHTDDQTISSRQQQVISNNHAAIGNNNDHKINDLNELMHAKKLKQEQQCRRKGFVGVLKTAKSLLSGGLLPSPGELTRRATSPGNLLFGSAGLIAAAIPLAVYLLPDGFSTLVHNSAGKRNWDSLLISDHISNNGRNGSSTTSSHPSPSDSSSSLTRFSLQGRVESMMGWIERSIEYLPNFPRLHPQECVKRSICEAYNDPNRYGLAGLALRMLFPATNLNITDRMDDMDYKVINKYRHAAGFGLSRRLENNGTGNVSICREKYEDCLISLLDLMEKLIELFTASKSNSGGSFDSNDISGSEI